MHQREFLGASLKVPILFDVNKDRKYFLGGVSYINAMVLKLEYCEMILGC